MKWREFEKNNPKTMYAELREICEVIHSQAGFFCNYCYQREGWYCFPCDKVRRTHEKRRGSSSTKLPVSSDKERPMTFMRGGINFWK